MYELTVRIFAEHSGNERVSEVVPRLKTFGVVFSFQIRSFIAFRIKFIFPVNFCTIYYSRFIRTVSVSHKAHQNKKKRRKERSRSHVCKGSDLEMSLRRRFSGVQCSSSQSNPARRPFGTALVLVNLTQSRILQDTSKQISSIEEMTEWPRRGLIFKPAR